MPGKRVDSISLGGRIFPATGDSTADQTSDPSGSEALRCIEAGRENESSDLIMDGGYSLARGFGDWILTFSCAWLRRLSSSPSPGILPFCLSARAELACRAGTARSLWRHDKP